MKTSQRRGSTCLENGIVLATISAFIIGIGTLCWQHSQEEEKRRLDKAAGVPISDDLFFDRVRVGDLRLIIREECARALRERGMVEK